MCYVWKATGPVSETLCCFLGTSVKSRIRVIAWIKCSAVVGYKKEGACKIGESMYISRNPDSVRTELSTK